MVVWTSKAAVGDTACWAGHCPTTSAMVGIPKYDPRVHHVDPEFIIWPLLKTFVNIEGGLVGVWIHLSKGLICEWMKRIESISETCGWNPVNSGVIRC